MQRQIEATDRKIDGPVYTLYGLTDEEIALVEDATPRAVTSAAGCAGLVTGADAWGSPGPIVLFSQPIVRGFSADGTILGKAYLTL